MSDKPLQDDERFAQLAQALEPSEETRQAPSRLKARIYSALVRREQSSGQLLSLTETRKAGQSLCVFESLWEQLPLGNTAKCFNCCSVCHARVLGERMERAPIYWAHCPYVLLGKK
jgi:hypothetical protein